MCRSNLRAYLPSSCSGETKNSTWRHININLYRQTFAFDLSKHNILSIYKFVHTQSQIVLGFATGYRQSINRNYSCRMNYLVVVARMHVKVVFVFTFGVFVCSNLKFNFVFLENTL